MTAQQNFTDEQKPDVLSEKCPSREVLNHVTSRWGTLVLFALNGETLRFSALRRRIGGVSERMLTHTLKLLEGDGLVLRQAYEVVPPHVEYSLTPLGQSAAKHVIALARWAEENVSEIAASKRQKS